MIHSAMHRYRELTCILVREYSFPFLFYCIFSQKEMKQNFKIQKVDQKESNSCKEPIVGVLVCYN